LSFDGITLRAVINEIAQQVLGAKIEKVSSIDSRSILLNLHQNGKYRQLLLSAHPENARLHLTSQKRITSDLPSSFCMKLRKDIEDGRITDIRQMGLDRICIIDIAKRSVAGETREWSLICELMGRRSNIVLVASASKLIADAIRHSSLGKNHFREVLPGKHYVLPPQNQNELLAASIDPGFLWQLLDGFDEATPLWRCINQSFSGISPLVARKLLIRVDIPIETTKNICGLHELQMICQSLSWLKQAIREKDFAPHLYLEQYNLNNSGGDSSTTKDYAVINLPGAVPSSGTASLCEFLDTYYNQKESQHQITSRKNRLENQLNAMGENIRNAIRTQEETLIRMEQAVQYKLAADLLFAHLHVLEPGLKAISLPNLFSENQEATSIELDPGKSGLENAREYYKKYTKARRSLKTVQLLLEDLQKKEQYLETIRVSLNFVQSEADLIDISEEVKEQKLIADPSSSKSSPKSEQKQKKIKKNQGIKQRVPAIMTVRLDDDHLIYVGKNNKQNDYLVTRLAKPWDIWLHAKNMPGGHIIIRQNNQSDDCPLSTILVAAGLAAYFSRGRSSPKVEVMYTKRKNVRKPSGAKPGQVLVAEYQSVWVAPHNIDQQT